MAAPAEDCAAPLGEINYLLRAVELCPCPVPLSRFGPRHSSAFPCALPEVQISPPFFVAVFNEVQERAGRQAKQRAIGAHERSGFGGRRASFFPCLALLCRLACLRAISDPTPLIPGEVRRKLVLAIKHFYR